MTRKEEETRRLPPGLFQPAAEAGEGIFHRILIGVEHHFDLKAKILQRGAHEARVPDRIVELPALDRIVGIADDERDPRFRKGACRNGGGHRGKAE